MRAALVASLCLALLAGCKEKNPYYCDNPPDNLCVEVDALETCSATKPCTTGICKESAGLCVECLDSTHCTIGIEPICDTTANTCGPCTKHTDCESEVCLETGACAAKADVLYVTVPGGADTNACTYDAPCATLTKAVSLTGTLFKIKGIVTETAEVTFNNRDAVIYGETAPQAVLTRPGGNEIVRIDVNSSVQILDLELSGATGNNGHGISILGGANRPITLKRLKLVNNDGLGIVAVGSGNLTITQSTFFDNEGGGLSIEGTHVFDVTSNFIIYNGSGTGTQSDKGGARIAANTASRFEFNTIAFNESSGLNNRGGLNCTAPMVMAGGNIIYRNSEADQILGGLKADATTQNNTGAGACPYGNTLVSVQDTQHLGFVKAVGMPPYDFHLLPTAPITVRDAGGNCMIRDVDNEPRPSGMACELGADELP